MTQIEIPDIPASNTGAIISDDGVYRYALWRVWDHNLDTVTWCMLNPSTADDVDNDPTIRKCMGFAKRWGYGGIRVVNLFAFRATDPKALSLAADPIGRHNARTLSTLTGTVIAAWGACIPRTTDADQQARTVRLMARASRGWVCLGFTKMGEPRHPCRLAYDTPRELWPREIQG